jgi:hypothetical protein
VLDHPTVGKSSKNLKYFMHVFAILLLFAPSNMTLLITKKNILGPNILGPSDKWLMLAWLRLKADKKHSITQTLFYNFCVI